MSGFGIASRTRTCRDALLACKDTAPTHAICEHDYSLISVPTSYGSLWINGIFVSLKNTAMDAPMRKANRSQKAAWEKVEAYALSLGSAAGEIQQEIEKQTRESVAGLHDIKTAVGVVLRSAEAIVATLPGYTDNERIEQADPPLKALLKAVNLLESRLALASIIANPASAKYGQPHRTPVYRLFHLMVRLFEQEASSRGVWLKMAGESRNELMLFDSFSTLPLVLIDNAIKYSSKHKDVVVFVTDLGKDHCKVTVESRGPLVPPQLRDKIFERGFRAPTAKRMVAAGSGLGLYIAKIVSDANGCQLTYSGTSRQHTDEEGKNVFSLVITNARTEPSR